MEDVLRLHSETLQYAAFFGLFASLGGLELWLSKEKAQRGQRWRTNIALTVLCVLVIGALPVSAVIAADYAATSQTGLLNITDLPLIIALVVGVLLRSFLSYLTHVAFHRAPWLWRLHAVHHMDTDMDVTTAVRMHPFEFIVSAVFVLPCIVAFGIPVEAIILYEILDAGMAVATHTNLRVPERIDRVLRWFLVTPTMHRIHHSAWQPETDSNFGATFSIWDHVFGTYRAASRDGVAPARLGLEGGESTARHHLGHLLALPVLGVPDSHDSQVNMHKGAG